MAAFERQRREMFLGGLIILVLAVVAVGLFLLDRVVGALQDNDRIVAVLPEAPKLTVGTEVWIGGKSVGKVATLALMPFKGDSLARVAVTLEFPHDVHEHVRKDSRIRITSARIIGVPVIDISPGTAASPIIGHGDTLRLDDLVTLVSLREKASSVGRALDSALTEVRTLSGPVHNRMASLEPVLRSMGLAQQEMAGLMSAFQAGPAAALMNDGRLNAELGSLQRTAAALGPAFQRAGSRMGDGPASLGQSFGRMQGNAERLSSALARLQTLMQDTNGTAYRMTADSALLKSLHGAQAQLDSLILEAKKNPLRFVF